MKKYRGIARLYEGTEFKRGRLLWERENLIVTAALAPICNLIAGVTAGQYISVMGFGSGVASPTLADTDLSTAPKYYNAMSSHSFPSAGSVQFNYGISGSTDYAAVGMTINELGFFANSATAGIPAAVGTTFPVWAATTAEVVGNCVVDANGNIQRCTTAGNTGTSAPTWATGIGGTTADSTGGGTVVWTLVALHTVPTPIYGHLAPVPAFPVLSGSSYAGSWTFIA